MENQPCQGRTSKQKNEAAKLEANSMMFYIHVLTPDKEPITNLRKTYNPISCKRSPKCPKPKISSLDPKPNISPYTTKIILTQVHEPLVPGKTHAMQS